MNDLYPPEFNDRPTHTEDDKKLVAAEARLLFWKRFTVFVGVITLLVCTAGTTTVVFLIRNTQVSGRPILVSAKAAAESSKQGTDRILDCTTIGGKCFDESQRRLAVQVASLIGDNRRAAAAASACAVQLASRLSTLDPHHGFLLVRACQRERLSGQ